MEKHGFSFLFSLVVLWIHLLYLEYSTHPPILETDALIVGTTDTLQGIAKRSNNHLSPMFTYFFFSDEEHALNLTQAGGLLALDPVPAPVRGNINLIPS
jgi:hypothetical protein